MVLPIRLWCLKISIFQPRWATRIFNVLPNVILALRVQVSRRSDTTFDGFICRNDFRNIVIIGKSICSYYYICIYLSTGEGKTTEFRWPMRTTPQYMHASRSPHHWYVIFNYFQYWHYWIVLFVYCIIYKSLYEYL